MYATHKYDCFQVFNIIMLVQIAFFNSMCYNSCETPSNETLVKKRMYVFVAFIPLYFTVYVLK